MKAKTHIINGVKAVPEDDYRRKLRFTARMLDYELELKNIGWGQEMMEQARRDPGKAIHLNENISRAVNSFKQKTSGYETELLKILDKYDMLMKNAKDEQARRALGALGVMEVSKLLDDYSIGKGAQLIINKEVIKTQETKDK